MWFYQPRHVSCSRYFQIPSFILAQSIRNNKSRTIWVWVHLQRSDNKITLTRCNFLHLSDCWLFNATLKILKFICCTLQFLRNTLLIPNLIMLLRYLILSGVRGVLANSVNRQKNYDKFLGFECRKNKFSDHLCHNDIRLWHWDARSTRNNRRRGRRLLIHQQPHLHDTQWFEQCYQSFRYEFYREVICLCACSDIESDKYSWHNRE